MGGGLVASLASAGINLADDALFAVLDVGSGNKKWQEAGLDFGKKVLTSAVNVAIGGVFNGFGVAKGAEATGAFWEKGIGGTITNTGLGGVLAKTALAGAQTMSTSLASGYINSWNLNYDKDGNISGMGWDANSFGMSAFGLTSLTSIASSMTSAFVGGGLGLANSANGLLTGFNDFQKDSVSKLNSFLGSLAGAGVTYGHSGNMTLNVLNSDDLGWGGSTGL